METHTSINQWWIYTWRKKKEKSICCYSLFSHPTPILTICRVHTAVPMLMYALVGTCWVHTSVPALLSYLTSSRATCWVRTLQTCSPNSNRPKCHIRFLEVPTLWFGPSVLVQNNYSSARFHLSTDILFHSIHIQVDLHQTSLLERTRMS